MILEERGNCALDFENEAFMEQVEKLVDERRWPQLRDMLLPLEPADIAHILDELPEDRLPLLYRLLPKELAAEVFVEMETDLQELLIKTFSDTELKEVLEELYVDDTVDIIEEMPASVVKRILKHADPETRKSINEILKYPEDSAGSIMTTEFVDLKKDMTVEDAIKRIRRTGLDKETINICYVTDPSRHLLGIVSIRTLLLAEEDDVISDIMDANVIYASTMDDKEDVAHACGGHGAAPGGYRHHRRRHGRHGGGGHRGLRAYGGHFAHRQALPAYRGVGDGEEPYPLADAADAVGHLHRHCHQQF